MPRKTSLNWFMPALVNSSVGSLAGTSEEEWTILCPFCSKKRRNMERTSEPEGILLGIRVGKPRFAPRKMGVSARGGRFDSNIGGMRQIEGVTCSEVTAQAPGEASNAQELMIQAIQA